MRRSMERAEQQARDEARRREEYTKSLEAKFEQERQQYQRQVGLLHFLPRDCNLARLHSATVVGNCHVRVLCRNGFIFFTNILGMYGV